MNRRHLMAALVAAGLPFSARASTYPDKTIRMLVGFAPGGSTDAAARLIATDLGRLLKEPVIVDNRPGVGGSLAAQLLARAPADGYTLMMGTFGALAVNQFIYKLNFDPATALAPVAKVADAYNVLVAPAASKYKSVKELVQAGKHASFGSSGPGSAGHLCGVLLNEKTNGSAVHVAYKGGGPLMTALLSNEVDFSFATSLTAIPLIRSDKLRALAITADKRISALPEVPTLMEDGTAPFVASNWHGVLAPAGTPKPIIDQLNRTIDEILKSADLKHKFNEHGLVAAPSTPAEFGSFMEVERKHWSAIVRQAGLKPE